MFYYILLFPDYKSRNKFYQASISLNGIDQSSAVNSKLASPIDNGFERIMKEIRRCLRGGGGFPDGYSAMMLVGEPGSDIFPRQKGNSSIQE